MNAPDSAGPIATSCHEAGSWAATRSSIGLTVSDDRASTEDPLESVEGRWTLQILLHLSAGQHRFSDLRAAIPRISANILTDRLRALESAGLVERHHPRPPHASQVYVLADLAAGLRPALDALARWRTETRNAPFPPGTGRSSTSDVEQSQ